jgi:uncharacterized SAM-binding protein YcdF (DUF218 family)
MLKKFNFHFKTRIVALVPTIATIALILIVHSTYLFSQKITHFGVMLPFAIGVFGLLWAFFYTSFAHYAAKSIIVNRVWKIGVLALCIWLVSVMLFFVWIHQSSQQRHLNLTTPPKFILVLGSSTPNCQASLTLVKRLERALEIAQTFPESPLLVSGGKVRATNCSEAQVMAEFLIEKGMPASRIWQETNSTSTHENLLMSQSILRGQGVKMTDHLLIVSSDFHGPRIQAIAAKLGFMSITMAGSETPWVSRYNAWLREYFAFISGWVFNEY